VASVPSDGNVDDQLQFPVDNIAKKKRREKHKVLDPKGYLGKRVAIRGTTRGDLNRRQGVAFLFDTKTGRYGVHVDNGRKVALKADKLTLVEESMAPPPDSRLPWFPVSCAAAGAAAVAAVLGCIRWQAQAGCQQT